MGIEPCTYCGRPQTERHERFPKRQSNVDKYGEAIIFHPLNCVPVCNNCNAGHANVDTLGEYEFVVMMVENRVLDFIPYKMDRKALEYVCEKAAEGFLRIDGTKIVYAEERTA